MAKKIIADLTENGEIARKGEGFDLSESERDSRARFSKAQLISSKRFGDRRDVLGALLSDNEDYTVETAERLITEFMKGQVK